MYVFVKDTFQEREVLVKYGTIIVLGQRDHFYEMKESEI
jgi:uncharacterized protein YqgQ